MARPSYIWRVRVCFACFSLLFFLFPFLFCLLSCCGPQKSDRRSGERRGGWDLHVGYISPTYRITLGVQLLVQRVRMRGELCYSADYKLCRTGWLFEPPATFTSIKSSPSSMRKIKKEKGKKNRSWENQGNLNPHIIREGPNHACLLLVPCPISFPTCYGRRHTRSRSPLHKQGAAK